MEKKIQAFQNTMEQERVHFELNTRKLVAKNRRLQKSQTEAEERLNDWILVHTTKPSNPRQAKPSGMPHEAHVLVNCHDSDDVISVESLAPPKRKLFLPFTKPEQKKKSRTKPKTR
jgi:hypothetical protein